MNRSLWHAWVEPWQGLAHDLAAAIPRLLSALLLLGVGISLALLTRDAGKRGLQRLGVDRSLPGLVFFRAWSLRNPGLTPSQGLAQAGAYAVFLLFALGSAHVMGGPFAQELLGALLRALPRLFSVLFILLLAVLLASAAGLLTQVLLRGSGSRHASFWSRVTAWGAFTACALFALEPLGLAGQLLGYAVLVLLAGLALGVGLALGLGCKDLARETVLELLKPDPGED